MKAAVAVQASDELDQLGLRRRRREPERLTEDACLRTGGRLRGYVADRTGVVADKVKNSPTGTGLNAATGEYEDLLAVGINDPVKVTRSALQNAASIAALFLTTEAVVADKPEKNAGPALPGGDEMGGMGF